MFEKTITKEVVYRGRIFDIERHEVALSKGYTSVREVIVHGPAVALIVEREDGDFVFIKQFRKAQEQVCLEIVAGNCESDEDHPQAAIRELREETGYQAEEVHLLGTMRPSVGYCTEQIDLYYARVGNQPDETDFDEDEQIETLILSAQEIEALMKSGEVDDAKTLSAWMLYRLKQA